MAATDHRAAWEPPLLSWKGMQLWSVGCRAPAICQIFIGLKAKKLSNLISHNNNNKKGKRRKHSEGEDGVHLSEDDAPAVDLPPPRCSSLPLPGPLSCCSSLDNMPHRHSVSIECSGHISNQLKRNASSNVKRNSDNLRRNSDVSLCHLQRLSTSSSSPGGGYERVWVLEGGDDGGLDYMLPREMKLGGRRSDVSVQLGRQDSSMSAHRRSSCSSFSSSSSSTSAVAKLAGRRSSASNESEQSHLMSQLLAGNQFLTHLTAAPVPSAMEHNMQPSEGILLDGSVRCREAELKDRIILFM